MQTISYSELQAFSQCKKMWEFGYVKGLRPKTEAEPLSLGSAGHIALEAYYLQEDWRKALYGWRDKALALSISDAPILSQNEQEDDDFFDIGSTTLQDIVDKVEQIIERYILKWGEEDKTWEILEVEKRFEIPIPGTDYLLVGVWDLIVRDGLGRVWIIDNKFPGKSFRDFESLELDAQIGIYQWAAREYGYNALGFIYNQILARLPELPKINKTKNKWGGQVSVADICSEWGTYKLFVIANGEEHLLDEYESEMVPKLNAKAFFDRKFLYRSPVEIDNFYLDLKARIEDLSRSKELIYRSPDKFKCNYCNFRELCKGELKGEDMEWYADMNFMQKERRGTIV